MHKSFMIDYSAYEKKLSSFSDLNLSGKKTLCIFTALSFSHYLCSSITGKIFHTYDFSPVSTITINYLKSPSWLEQCQKGSFLHLEDESCYYRAR